MSVVRTLATAYKSISISISISMLTALAGMSVCVIALDACEVVEVKGGGPATPAAAGQPTSGAAPATTSAEGSATGASTVAAAGTGATTMATGTTASTATATAATAAPTTAAPTGGTPATGGAAQPCTGSFGSLGSVKNARCVCTGKESGPVYGTGPYTTDSFVCTAARHAGLITAAGGTVEVTASTGCSGYGGGAANGVGALPWDDYPYSFFFPAAGNGTCTACPRAFNTLAATVNDLQCSCAPLHTTGTVYGTGVYTSDSNICSAAQHAGVIPATGGNVKVKRMAGCKSYKGSVANGYTTQAYGSWDSSFFFVGGAITTCP